MIASETPATPSALPARMTNGRSRASTLASTDTSLPGVPQNTPAASHWGDLTQHPDPYMVHEAILVSADSAIGLPTFVPCNTPLSSAPASVCSGYRSMRMAIPAIREKLQPLSGPPSPVETVVSNNVSEHYFAVPAEGEIKRPISPPDVISSLGGVMELNDWHDEAEDVLDRGLKKLAQLADDDFQKDSSKSAEEHFQTRLTRLLAKNRYTKKSITSSMSSMSLDTLRSDAATPVQAAMVTAYEFRELKAAVGSLTVTIDSSLQRQVDQDVKLNTLIEDVKGVKEQLEKQKDDIKGT